MLFNLHYTLTLLLTALSIHTSSHTSSYSSPVPQLDALNACCNDCVALLSQCLYDYPFDGDGEDVMERCSMYMVSINHESEEY